MKAIAVVVATLLASAFAGCSGDSNEPPPTPTIVAATPTAAAVTTLTLGEDTALPAGQEFFVETGCWQCDGGPEGLYRVSASGAVPPTVERIATDLPGVYFGSMMSVNGTLWTQLAPDGFRFCSECFPSGLTIYRSDDGGRTFIEATRLTDSHEAIAVALDDDVVLQALGAYRTLTGPLTPPGDNFVMPVALSGAKVGWRLPRRNDVVDVAGTTVITVAPEREIWMVSAVPSASNAAFVVYSRSQADNRYFVSHIVDGAIVADLVIESGSITNLIATHHNPGGAPSIIGNLLLDNPLSTSPVVIDLDAGILHRITDPFASKPFTGERNHIVGVR